MMPSQEIQTKCRVRSPTVVDHGYERSRQHAPNVVDGLTMATASVARMSGRGDARKGTPRLPRPGRVDDPVRRPEPVCPTVVG